VHKIVFESVVLNPTLESNAFLRPDVRGIKPAAGLAAGTALIRPAESKPLANSAKSN
jgi:hypothetical protein